MPLVEAFPKNFRMIASSGDNGANAGGELGGNMFTECCNYVNGQEDCQNWNRLHFPTQTCDFLGIAFGTFLLLHRPELLSGLHEKNITLTRCHYFLLFPL